MPPHDDDPEKATDDVPTGPLIHVDVSRETVQRAELLADECGIALEDALARLTAYDLPADAPSDSPGVTESNVGP